MNIKHKKPDTESILKVLKDFQRQTVDYVYRRLYEDSDAVGRFLIADEVGLGKTLVARGIIAKAVERLWNEKDRIDIVYICSNQDIAHQNINRLSITDIKITHTNRITLLPHYIQNLKGNKINFISFTPGTSFDLRSKGGIVEERALIYHILKECWDLGDISGPKNLLQCDVGKDPWRWRIDNFETDKIDKELIEKYRDSLQKDENIRRRFNTLVERFSHYRGKIPGQDREDQHKLIGDLRRILAETCVKALAPDIVILDEFQRFKNLLDEKEDIALLAQTLFNYPACKVLLLSATPYKMYTMHHESAEDDHYSDFIRTLEFLFNSKDQINSFEEDLQLYRRELFHIKGNDSSELYQAKESIEKKLRKVMVRTERTSATEDKNSMIIESKDDLGCLTPKELNSFVMLDNVARILEVSDTVEYWKSAPYLLNFMDQSYLIKRKLFDSVEAEYNEDLAKILEAGKENLLSWKTIRSYEKLDPNNSKLRTLISQTVERGGWKLLWIPPSLPYYEVATGPFSCPDLKDITKALVFSSWLVVPKTIATLCSYEAERLMFSTFEGTHDYIEERRRQKPLIKFAISEDRHPTGMSNFNLIYPCMSLASLVDPLEIIVCLEDKDTKPSQELVYDGILTKIKSLIEPILHKQYSSNLQTDERWYWAALALLDSYYYNEQVGEWFGNSEGLAWKEMIQHRKGDDVDSRFAEHVELFYNYFKGEGKLGKPPNDLVQVLAKVALASPAVVSLRSLQRFCKEPEPEILLAGAAKMALGFRSLFNMPESITLIRSQQVDESRYWENVLDYCINGNLQSVMDEYLHILYESLGLINTPADDAVCELSDEVHTAVSIRTVNLDFDEIKVQSKSNRINLVPNRLRCRFALRFGDGKNEEDEDETRADQVRKAFNSPFRPFILASTSIGQEGLDFHQYCHEIYHWNLPSNPVDLEQREGRIHRYKGHAIRKNIAKEFTLASLAKRVNKLDDPWGILFSYAVDKRAPDQNDMTPFWVFEPKEGGYKICRHIPALPLSRELQQYDDLCKSLVTYRMVFGQPRQEDLVKYLQSRLKSDLNLTELLKYRINLSPESHIEEKSHKI